MGGPVPMDLEVQGTPRGGGTLPGPQGTTFPAPHIYYPYAPPGGSVQNYNPQFAQYMFPSAPVAQTNVGAPLPSNPPSDAWQVPPPVNYAQQQTLQDRVMELTELNARAQAEVERLHRENLELRRRIDDTENALLKRELAISQREVAIIQKETEAELARRAAAPSLPSTDQPRPAHKSADHSRPAHRITDTPTRRVHPYNRDGCPPSTSSSSSMEGRRPGEHSSRYGSAQPPHHSAHPKPASARSESAGHMKKGKFIGTSFKERTTAIAVRAQDTTNKMNTDDANEDDVTFTGDTVDLETALLTSSERASVGTRDPSVELHPLSKWYAEFYRRAGSSLDKAPAYSDDPTNKPGVELPHWALKYIGTKAERAEAKRIRLAKEADARGEGFKPKDKGVQRTPPEMGRWKDLVIITANQAHNVRHLAIIQKDKYAARVIREYNRAHQDPLEDRTEGGRILMGGYNRDFPHFPPDEYYDKPARDDPAAPTTAATIAANGGQLTHAATTGPVNHQTQPNPIPAPPTTVTPADTLLRPVASLPLASPSVCNESPSAPSSPALPPLDLASTYWVLPATVASEAWDVRACAGLHRHLTPSKGSSELIRAFEAIPTERWPIAMRAADGTFPLRGKELFRTPLIDDVLAESFITSILPVVPSGREELYGESAFFRALIELFSLPDVFDWIVKHGDYHLILVDDPAPYPFDCSDLGLHHVAAWACRCGVTSTPALPSWIAAYAHHTRNLLEGRPDGKLAGASFDSAPALSSYIIQDRHVRFIPPYDAQIHRSRVEYDSIMTDVSSVPLC